MTKIISLFLFFAFSGFNVFAQFSKYVIQLKDKTGTPFSINNPSEFLSPKSIQRRVKQNIEVTESDLPISPRYLDSIRSIGNVTVLNQSKWLNQVCIETVDQNALEKIKSFSFVKSSKPVQRKFNPVVISREKFNEEIKGRDSSKSPFDTKDYYTYGHSFDQINIHHGEYLHNNGFHGEGMLIAILDAGFYHYQTLPAFDSVRMNGQILDTYDFVDNKNDLNEQSAHGMQCFSIIASNIPGELVGSSPKANFYLYRTEDASSESLVEEQYWIAAAERADSIGVDVITTSLGYNRFDNPVFDHTYQDMNGKTTMIAKAASMAAQKGMIVLAAAGNEGNDPWHFIVTPADADSILTVGAVNYSGNPASFSSYGPSSDGRVKPTVASVGVGTAISSTTGPIVTGNGTSFATPNLAGLVTCLWQAFPDFTNMEIIKAVKKSSSKYFSPDERIGYGIPNFELAFKDLEQQRENRNIITILGDERLKVYPNPFSNEIIIAINPENTGKIYFRLLDVTGKLYLKKEQNVIGDQPQQISLVFINPLPAGIYFLQFFDGKKLKTIKLISEKK
jgi:subtilisin family serine protease